MHDYFKNTGTFEEGSWMHNNDPIGGKQCQPKNRQRRTYWKTHFFAQPIFHNGFITDML